MISCSATSVVLTPFPVVSKFKTVVEVIFQKRVRVFHRGFKHEKTDENFRVFETPMKHEARVFEITSPTKEISFNYHLKRVSQFNYYI